MRKHMRTHTCTHTQRSWPVNCFSYEAAFTPLFRLQPDLLVLDTMLCVQSDKDIDALSASAPVVIDHPREVDLAMHLSRFPEAVEDMLAELAPNR